MKLSAGISLTSKMSLKTKVSTEVESSACSSQDVKTTFVIGLPRAGTTLLASLLAGSDSVISLSEPFLSRTARRHWLLNPIFFPKIRNYRITPPRNGDEMDFLVYLKNFANDLGFSSLIIKETYRLCPCLENTTILNRIATSGEPVVAITRHPYDTAVSTIRLFRRFRGINGKLMRIIVSGLPVFSGDRKVVEWFAQNWVDFARWCEQEEFFVVKYEHLVRNPDHYLRTICERYSIPFTQEMLNRNHPRSFFGVSGDSGVLGNRKKEIVVRPVGRCDQLPSEFIDIIKTTCGEAVKEMDYSL